MYLKKINKMTKEKKKFKKIKECYYKDELTNIITFGTIFTMSGLISLALLLIDVSFRCLSNRDLGTMNFSLGLKLSFLLLFLGIILILIPIRRKVWYEEI